MGQGEHRSHGAGDWQAPRARELRAVPLIAGCRMPEMDGVASWDNPACSSGTVVANGTDCNAAQLWPRYTCDFPGQCVNGNFEANGRCFWECPLSTTVCNEIRQCEIDNCEYLCLENGVLTEAKAYSFPASLILLDKLDLSGNEIAVVQETAFAGLALLRELHMQENQITEIHARAFVQLPKLRRLYLGQNFLRDIPDDVFSGLGLLLYLNLEFNLVADIKPSTFADLTSLKTLDLRFNKIRIVKKQAFVNLTMLQELHLESNLIEVVQQDAFAHLNDLSSLYLGSNQIMIVKENVFANLQKLTLLHLQDNWVCVVDQSEMEAICKLPELQNKYAQIGRRLRVTALYFMARNPVSIRCAGAMTDVTKVTCLDPIIPASTHANENHSNRGCLFDSVRLAPACSLDSTDGCVSSSTTKQNWICDESSGRISAMSHDPSTVLPSTEGTSHVTIHGLKYSSYVVFRVRGFDEACNQRNGILECPVPVGAGLAQPFELEWQSYVRDPENLYQPIVVTSCNFSYQAPHIVRVSGCSDAHAARCSRSGGDNLIFDGKNFGGAHALVFINGAACESLRHGSNGTQCGASAPDKACHRRVVCRAPALSSPHPKENAVLLMQSNQYSLYSKFYYETCASNEYQKQIDSHYGCSSCSVGRQSTGPDAEYCDRCDLWYQGSPGHCEVPVFGLLFGLFLGVVFFTVGWKLWKRFSVITREAEAARHKFNQQRLMTRRLQGTVNFMKNAWQFGEDEIEFQQKLASGGYGDVWVGALHHKWKVAIKTMRPSKEGRGSRKFDDSEVDFLTKTRHPKLVMFLGCGTMKDGTVFIVIEHMAGGSLDQRLWGNTRPMRWLQRISCLRDIMEGLAYLHLMHKAIHRDLKSPNVLLEKAAGSRSITWRAKLADFGLSKIVLSGKKSVHHKSKYTAKNSRKRRNAAHWSKIMTLNVGTMEWMGPELFGKNASGEITPATDMYALGVIMYELLEHAKPWNGYDAEHVREAVLQGQRPKHSHTAEANAPANFIGLMVSCWEHNVIRRCDIAEALVVVDKIESTIPVSSGSCALDGQARNMEESKGLAIQGQSMAAAIAVLEIDPCAAK